MRALPSVSVCIPVYRGEQFLAETIRSVLDQTYRDFELVILDNASPDDSGRIARSFGDRRIRIETNATTLPQPENWREVVRLCRGPLIKLVCADDLLHPRCLEYQVGPDGGRPRPRGGRRPPAHDRRAQPGARPPPRPDRAHGRAVQRRGRPARRAQRREPDRRARRGAVPPRALLRRRRLAARAALRHGPRPVDPAAAVRASSSACPRPSPRSASARRASRPTTRPTIYAEQKAYIEELAATPHLQVRKIGPRAGPDARAAGADAPPRAVPDVAAARPAATSGWRTPTPEPRDPLRRARSIRARVAHLLQLTPLRA